MTVNQIRFCRFDALSGDGSFFTFTIILQIYFYVCWIFVNGSMVLEGLRHLFWLPS